MKRWRALIHYRTNNGMTVVPFELEELDELQDIVERGPDWNTIVKVEIVLARVGTPGMTVEQDEGVFDWRRELIP